MNYTLVQINFKKRNKMTYGSVDLHVLQSNAHYSLEMRQLWSEGMD